MYAGFDCELLRVLLFGSGGGNDKFRKSAVFVNNDSDGNGRGGSNNRSRNNSE